MGGVFFRLRVEQRVSRVPILPARSRNFRTLYAAVDMLSTDTERRAVPLQQLKSAVSWTTPTTAAGLLPTAECNRLRPSDCPTASTLTFEPYVTFDFDLLLVYGS